jgi:hypothetical protein
VPSGINFSLVDRSTSFCCPAFREFAGHDEAVPGLRYYRLYDLQNVRAFRGQTADFRLIRSGFLQNGDIKKGGDEFATLPFKPAGLQNHIVLSG